MQLQLDNNNVIIGYANFGEIKNGVEFDESKVPDDFYEQFKPTFYMLKDDEIVENPDYVEPSNDVPTGPTDTQTILKALLDQAADHCEKLDKLNDRIDALEN